jgi:hypothetical protein
MPGLNGFRDGLADLMLKFGHLCDNGNDFSTSPGARTATPSCAWSLRACPGEPAQRRQTASPGRQEKIRMESIRMPLWKGWMLRRLYRRTRRYNLYREHISYIYTYGYGLFRSYFLALGDHLVRSGLIGRARRYFLSGMGADPPRRRGRARLARRTARDCCGHKQAIEQVRSVQLPTIIYGDECPPVEFTAARKLAGVPTSRGYCTGR